MKYSVVALFLSASFVAQAQNVVSWNADVFGTIGGASQYAGVVSAPYWNDSWTMNGNANGSAGIAWANLVDNTGTATGMSATYVNYLNWWQYYQIQGSAPGQDGSGTYNRNLLNGFLNDGASNDSGGANLSLSSIPYAQYDLYVYFSSDAAGRAGTVTVGSTTYDFSTLGAASISGADAVLTQTTDTGGANPGANYAVFSGLTGSSQNINMNIPLWGGIAGFQVVAVPEPGTLALASVGGLMVLGLRRRFKK